MRAPVRLRYGLALLACIAMIATGCSGSKVKTSSSPSASATPTPTVTDTVTPAVTVTATATPTPTVTASASATPKASASPSVSPKAPAAPAASPSVSSLSGSANIFAAASLTGAFNKIKADFIALNPKVNLTINYNGSGSLVTQIQNGAPADVFASADTDNMNKLSGVGKIDAPQNFADNLLEIVVQHGNPRNIQTLADLAKPGLAVVLGDPASVPAGKYAKQALAAAGVTVVPKSLELSVTAVTQKIALAEADAGIVYVTDVKASVAAGQFVDGVQIPRAQNVLAVYPIGILKSSQNQAIDRAFVNYVLSPAGQATLTSFGFLPPS
jgi:molybdate transport system substrate-binding protein